MLRNAKSILSTLIIILATFQFAHAQGNDGYGVIRENDPYGEHMRDKVMRKQSDLEDREKAAAATRASQLEEEKARQPKLVRMTFGNAEAHKVSMIEFGRASDDLASLEKIGEALGAISPDSLSPDSKAKVRKEISDAKAKALDSVMANGKFLWDLMLKNTLGLGGVAIDEKAQIELNQRVTYKDFSVHAFVLSKSSDNRSPELITSITSMDLKISIQDDGRHILVDMENGWLRDRDIILVLRLKASNEEYVVAGHIRD